MHVRDYAQAVSELITGGKPVDTVLSKLKSVMERRGHEQLYPRVLRELAQQEEKRAQREKTVVTVARVADISRHDLKIEQSLSRVGATTEYETRVDPTVIGGFKVTQYDKAIDSTYKRRLVEIYRSIIG